MKYTLYDHAGKGLHLHQALLTHGHEPTQDLADADLLLIDCDWAWAHPRPEVIQAAHEAGAKVVLYPHGGLFTAFVYDGLTEPNPLVDLRLEHGLGSREIVVLDLQVDLKQEAVGWLYSPTAEFTAVENPKRLLFCPMHPNIEALQRGMNGHDPAPAMNQALYKQLLELGFDLTISIVAPPYRNGLWAHPRASFVFNHEMNLQASQHLIDEADVVVATGTLAALAVARGKPTVMFGQGDFTDYVDGGYRTAEHPDLYADLCRYPYDAEEEDLGDVLAQACQQEAIEWRQRWIGEDGAEAAVVLLEQLIPAAASNGSVIIQGVTARATGTGG